MREIKFRAWDKKKNAMFDVVAINFQTERIFQTWRDENNRNLYAPFDEAVLMQYTGLKDKNGKEIYESDILKDDENMLWEVIWDNGYFKLENIDIPGRQFIYDDLEIVGNIYENPVVERITEVGILSEVEEFEYNKKLKRG